jgi:hypothetical protein
MVSGAAAAYRGTLSATVHIVHWFTADESMDTS